MKLFFTLKLLITFCYITYSQSFSAGVNNSYLGCSSGQIVSIGTNDNGQLGNESAPTIGYSNSLVNIPNRIIQVSSGYYHCIFLDENGIVWGCGGNSFGQIGDGTNNDKYSPVSITSLNQIISISSGNSHSLFLKSDGTVWATGLNNFGQLGDGTTTNRNYPVPINISNVEKIYAGARYSFFIKTDGTLWACGGNVKGQLGDGTRTTRLNPVQINLSNITSVAPGDDQTFFLKSTGNVWACGENYSIGIGVQDGQSIIPVELTTLENITKISSGISAGYFLLSNGTVWSCGRNDFGELGDGTFIDKLLPVPITTISNVMDIDSKFFHAIFKNEDGFYVTGFYSGGLSLYNAETPIMMPDLCQVLDLDDQIANSDFTISPNPTHGTFTLLNIPFNSDEIIVSNMMGQIILKSNITSSSSDYKIPFPVSGLYTCQLLRSGAIIKIKKLLIN